MPFLGKQLQPLERAVLYDEIRCTSPRASAVVAALADPAVRRRFKDVGQDIWPVAQQTPEALAALQKSEIATWWPIIKAAGIKAE